MSLADCITKAGKALDGKDKAAIEAFVAGGMSETDAVQQHLAVLDQDLDGVVGQIEEAGGEVKRNEPAQFGQQDLDDGPESPAWKAAVAKGLDMSKEARMERARDEGYDTDQTYYHGTGEVFSEFQENLDDTGELGGGIYLTTNPSSASSYAELGQNPNVIPVLIKKGEILDVTGKEDMPSTMQMKEAGYVAVVDNSDGRNQLSVFDPSNIRSINAAFDPDQADSPVLLAQNPVPQIDKNLIVTHNLNAENILAAADIGGLAAPSIAVTRTDISDFDQFGEVSLLADPSLLESAKSRIFDADIYSPRQPRATYDIDSNKFAELYNQLDPDRLGLSRPDIQSLEDGSGADNLQRSTAVQYLWLQQQGKAPKQKQKTVDAVIKKAQRLMQADEIRDFHDLAKSEKFQKMAKQHYDKMLKKVAAADEGRVERYRDFWFDDDGNVLPRKIIDLAHEVDRYNRENGIDVSKLRQDIDKKFRTKKARAEYDQWVTDQFNEMVKGKKLFKGFTPAGNRRYVDYNMQNVVKEMTQNLQGGEASFYGAGSIRSTYANELKSVKKVQQNRDKIVSEEAMNQIKEDSSQVLEEVLDKLKPFYKFDADSWNYADDAGSAIMEGPAGLRETFKDTPEVREIVTDFTEYLAALPSSYFEAKIQRPVGFDEFNTAVVPRGMRKDAVKALKDAGLKIKTYDPSGKGKTRQEVIAEQEKLLFQDGKDTPRGTISLLPTGERIIQLGKDSDPSTFLHETAHLFLELEKQFAEEFGITEDQQAILDWLGVESFDDITVEHHEKFAETFEVYLETGKAPSLALRDAFAAFRRWLTAVYRALDPRVRAELNPEITAIFDRLLATEDEIQEAYANPAYDQFFRSKEQAGMTDAEWAAYEKRVQRAKDKAQSTIDQKIIAQLTRLKTAEWKAEKAPLVEQEKERLSKLPVYQILSDAKEGPMNHALVAEINGGKIPGNMIGKTKTDGIDPAEYAEVYGYASADMMIKAIRTTPALNKAADDAAQALMLEKYGDILNDGSIEREAQEAIQNDEQAALLLMELRALTKKTGRAAINREYLKAQTKQMIEGMTYAEIKPGKFYRAELRAAQKAAKATNDQEAHEAKTQQIINHYLYRESLLTREAMTRQRKYVRRAQTKTYSRTEVDQEYALNRMLLAKSYNMQQGSAAKRLDVERVISWMITQIQVPNGYADLTVIDPKIAKIIKDKIAGRPVDYSLPSFDDLTAEDLKSLHEQLKHMRFIGGKLSDKAKAELSIARASFADSVKVNATKSIDVTMEEKSGTERVLDEFKEFIFSHRRLGGIMETLDGFENGGPGADVYNSVTKASNEELTLTDQMATEMDAAFKPVLKLISKRHKATIRKADGGMFTLSHRQRFVLALNWGNDGNRQAVLQGLNQNLPGLYVESDVLAMIGGMSEAELNAVNAVWAAKEKLWPSMSGVETRVKGFSPPKVEAVPFEVNGVKLTGGHYQLHYRRSPDDSARKDLTIEKGARSSIKLGTAGALNERVGSGGRLVDLDLSHLFVDMSEDIHYIAFAEVSGYLNAIFKGVENPVVSEIQRGYGDNYYDNVIETIDSIIAPAEPTLGLWKFLKWVRGNMTYAFLAGSIRNILQQPIAVTNAISQIELKYVLQGMMEFYVDPVGNWEKIGDIDPFMKNRTKLVNREAREQLLKIDSIHPKLGAMKNMAFLPQTFMDSLIAYPVWMGAKTKYKNEHPAASESEAIDYAREMVKKTIGSGLSQDVGAVLNKGEAYKQITFMGTFFNLTWNLHVENAQLLKRGKISGMEYARRLGWMAIAPALISMWVLDDVPEDEDELIAHMLKEVGRYNMASLFLLKDIASAMDGFSSSIPGLKFADGIARVTKDMKDVVSGDEEADMELVVSILRGLQPVTKIPASGQITRTLDGVNDPDQDAWGALVEGKERN